MLKLLGETLNARIYYISQVALWNLQEPISFFLSTFGAWGLPFISSFVLNFIFQIFHILCAIYDDGLAMVELPQKSKSKRQLQYHCPILGTQIPTHTINKITDWCKVLGIREEKENQEFPFCSTPPHWYH